MIRRKRRRILKMLSSVATGGVVLQVACLPAGTGKFLAPVVQPIIGQVLSDFTTAFTTNAIAILTSIVNQIFGITA